MLKLRNSVAVYIAGILAVCTPVCAQLEIPVENLPAVRAPELQPNLGWLNTDRPLRFSHELKGQVVLLDFWTYCCINCIHILPDLEFLEEKYADQPFAVIGVHSAKFENEANRETIRAATQRYKIKHPVVIDDDMGIWSRYTAKGWPTFVLVDSTGRVVGMTSGEGHRDELDAAIERLLSEGRAKDTLASAPLKINSTGFLAPTGVLAFPGKVLADAESNRLFIADSNHNRLVVTTLPDSSGHSQLVSVIGGGKEGKADGTFTDASFQNPQGMALRGDLLYIADTDNHLIREANLETSTVRTIAGTGSQGYDRRGGAKGAAQPLSSPWALELVGNNQLFIGMAGIHQIWVMDLDSEIIKNFSGNGAENIVDGSAEEANFAQPSGLAYLNEKLYVADSEVSGIREVDPKTGAVGTVVGSGLFIFGDVDGQGEDVRLQHALGITAWNDNLLIADTYNHRIKRIDPSSRQVTTLFGTGKTGTKSTDGKPAFFEPGGLDIAGDWLFVADTNNHRIVAVDLITGAWNEVMISGLSAPKAAARPVDAVDASKVIISDKAPTVTLTLDAELPTNAHPSAEAPMQIRVLNGEEILAQQTLKTDRLPVSVDLDSASIPTSGTLTIRWSFAWCTEGNASVCVPQRHNWSLPIEKTAGVAGAIIELKGKAKK